MAAMKKCPFCGGEVASDQQKCPCCGGANANYVERFIQLPYSPKTIKELKAYCAERGMPLHRMRFFVDEDYRGAKAYGVCRIGDDFIVYKNKSDGSRFVRYQGPDEVAATRELFSKLLDECHIRGIYPENWTPDSKE